MPIFIIFIIIPLIEVALFIEAGEAIGIGYTLFLCVLTAFIGAALVRHQGIQTLAAAQQSLNQGALPVQEIFDGFCILAAGLTLITPGFFTDGLGFLLLFPPFRVWLRRFVSQRFDFKASGYPGPGRGHDDPDIIEGEYIEIKDEEENQDKS